MDEILSQVQKPGRYIGGEWNVPKKDFGAAKIKFGLCFPDLYEVGMSNLGLRIIYGILNALPGISCERFFACQEDMEDILRSCQGEILSLESRRKMRDFDIIGFSLGYELNYTNVLNMLELGRIPLKARERGCDYPLVIGGGPCAMNPEPMHEFFDLFLIGEAEEAILEIMGIYAKAKDRFRQAKLSKEDLLLMLAQIQGVYVPSLYEVTYDAWGRISEFRPKMAGVPSRVRKRFVRDLGSVRFPEDWLVPYIQIVHDRIIIEIMRGCPNRCRFCQARQQYFPFRQRKVEEVLHLAAKTYKNTGYEEISLAGLSTSDYPKIEELMKELVALFKERAVSISLPSLKPKAVIGNLSALIASIKKTGFTFAPEAGSERLRNLLAKDFNLQDFLGAVEEAYREGYQHIKLYFMVGLPSEEEGDLDGIIQLASCVSELRRKAGKGPAEVNISINTLIPKPHTPFQWLAMPELEKIKAKYDYLKSKAKRNHRLKINLHNPQMSILEGVLSRGDRRLAQVIYSAFKKKAKFDAWTDHFVFEKWLEAFCESGLDPNFYLKERQRDELLPWAFIDTGVSAEYLRREAQEVEREIRSRANKELAITRNIG
jgi:radical SAM family uncharacterized protein